MQNLSGLPRPPIHIPARTAIVRDDKNAMTEQHRDNLDLLEVAGRRASGSWSDSLIRDSQSSSVAVEERSRDSFEYLNGNIFDL